MKRPTKHTALAGQLLGLAHPQLVQIGGGRHVEYLDVNDDGKIDKIVYDRKGQVKKIIFGGT